MRKKYQNALQINWRSSFQIIRVIQTHKLLPRLRILIILNFLHPYSYHSKKSVILVILADSSPQGKHQDDNIPNPALKHLPKVAIIKWTQIYTSYLRISYFPFHGKKVTIVMILKPGKDHGRPENYRPIYLLINVSKPFERILFTH